MKRRDYIKSTAIFSLSANFINCYNTKIRHSYEFWPKDFRTMTGIEIRSVMIGPDGYNTRHGTCIILDNCTDVPVEPVPF